MKVQERLEDMSVRGRLRLIEQDDGDIIVAVQSMDNNGFLQPGDSVEFCALFSGGGGSPKTLDALRALMEAMRQDNLNNPRKKPTDDLWILS